MITIVSLAALCLSAGAAEGREVYRAVLDDDIINPPTAEYLISAIEQAEAAQADCLVVEIDTPGGLLASTRRIVKRMLNAKVPVVTFVGPKGARAGSAGVFITIAGDIAAMAPSTNIGAAHPVQVGEKPRAKDNITRILERIFGPLDEKNEKDKPRETMEQKILSDTTAWARALAEERGRNTAWAVKAVEESASVTAERALKLGVIDLIADDTDDLLDRIDGRTVRRGGERVTLDTTGSDVVEVEKGVRLAILTVLAHPNIAYILLMLGFYGLIFEFTNPGVGFPGIAGAICIVLSFFGLQVLPTSYAGVALIAIAVALFIAEIKITSYGFLTLGGIVSFLTGSLILFKSPHDFMRVSIPIVAAFTLSTLAVAGFLAWLAARSHRMRARTGSEGMVGSRGKVKSWRAGSGKVFVHGETWSAEGPEGLAEGDDIEVVSEEGMILKIKALEEGARR